MCGHLFKSHIFSYIVTYANLPVPSWMTCFGVQSFTSLQKHRNFMLIINSTETYLCSIIHIHKSLEEDNLNSKNMTVLFGPHLIFFYDSNFLWDFSLPFNWRILYMVINNPGLDMILSYFVPVDVFCDQQPPYVPAFCTRNNAIIANCDNLYRQSRHCIYTIILNLNTFYPSCAVRTYKQSKW